jgi:hypothetical protein
MRGNRCAAPSRQDEPFNFAPELITHIRRPSRQAAFQNTFQVRESMRWPIASRQVCGCLNSPNIAVSFCVVLSQSRTANPVYYFSESDLAHMKSRRLLAETMTPVRTEARRPGYWRNRSHKNGFTRTSVRGAKGKTRCRNAGSLGFWFTWSLD